MSGQVGFERVAQKQRTRKALLEAARAMLVGGHQPTVPEVADRAGISRATAYRYFSTPAGMAEEAVLDAIADEFERLDLAGAMSAATGEDRTEEVVSAVLKMVLRNEAMFRTYLALVVAQEGGSRRGGRRVRWLADALAPLAETMPAAAFKRLVNALALAAGFETIIVLKDVCGLEPSEIDQTARWLARVLVRNAQAS